jgi:hypothetical protein
MEAAGTEMKSIQEKRLKELRKRLAILNGVIADFERLEATRKGARGRSFPARMARYGNAWRLGYRSVPRNIESIADSAVNE